MKRQTHQRTLGLCGVMAAGLMVFEIVGAGSAVMSPAGRGDHAPTSNAPPATPLAQRPAVRPSAAQPRRDTVKSGDSSASPPSDVDCPKKAYPHVRPLKDRFARMLGQRQSAGLGHQRLAAAWRSLERRRPVQAVAQFKAVLDMPRLPDADRLQALFGLGESYRFQIPSPEVDQARAAFNKILSDFPHSTVAPWALIELGQLEGFDTRTERDAARRQFRAVLRQYPDSPACDEAALRLGASYFQEVDTTLASRGREVLVQYLEEHPDNPLAWLMHFRLIYWYAVVERNYQASSAQAKAVAKTQMADPFRWALIYWHIAQADRLRLGKPREAMCWYRKLVEKCPHDVLAFAAKNYGKQLKARLQAHDVHDAADNAKKGGSDAP